MRAYAALLYAYIFSCYAANNAGAYIRYGRCSWLYYTLREYFSNITLMPCHSAAIFHRTAQSRAAAGRLLRKATAAAAAAMLMLILLIRLRWILELCAACGDAAKNNSITPNYAASPPAAIALRSSAASCHHQRTPTHIAAVHAQYRQIYQGCARYDQFRLAPSSAAPCAHGSSPPLTRDIMLIYIGLLIYGR